MLWTYRPKSVQELTHFRAADPWNEDRPAAFHLLRCFSSAVLPLAVAYEDESRPQRLAILSELDEEFRFLPDALTALWKNGRIPAERLPALLKQLEPGLIRSDFFRLLALNGMQRGVRTWAAPCVGLIWVLAGSVAMTDSILFGGTLAALGVIIAVGSFTLVRKWTRRRQHQVSWALANRH
jgi:hypothetical protein